MGAVPTEFTVGKDPMSTTTPAASAAATEIETTGAPILGFLQLNTSNGKVFLNATAPSSEFQSSTAFDVDGWAPELPYVEVSFTAAGLSEADEADLVDAGYRPVIGLVRGVLATVIAPAPGADAPDYLFVDFESTGLPQIAPGGAEPALRAAAGRRRRSGRRAERRGDLRGKDQRHDRAAGVDGPLRAQHAHRDRPARRPGSRGTAPGSLDSLTCCVAAGVPLWRRRAHISQDNGPWADRCQCRK